VRLTLHPLKPDAIGQSSTDTLLSRQPIPVGTQSVVKMATEEWLLKAIQAGKNYEELPPRVRSILTVGEWKSRVKDYCLVRGMGWGESQASQVSAEMEYYEDLLRFSKQTYRLFPYHLSDYICRMLRVTPFKYYCDVLYNALKEEKQYDQIANFTAADIKRLSGIGRNEYIEILNQCKAKKLLWRVNKGIAREFLPSEPLDIPLEPWWHVLVVNIGEMEYRALTPEELKTLQDACSPGGSQVGGLDSGVLRALYKRGLVYIEVPIAPDDMVSIPHLEGFVSNRDSVGMQADPMEALLHQVFVAASETTTVAELAEMLSVELPKVIASVSMACRLGFALRQPRPGGEVHIPVPGRASDLQAVGIPGVAANGLGKAGGPLLQQQQPQEGRDALQDADTEGSLKTEGVAGVLSDVAPAAPGTSKAVALVVDATVTSYLMMGSMAGLKRHAVTLFEGGRVSGAEPMGSLIAELQGVSESRLDVFEGEMADLMSHTASLAHALEYVRSAAQGGNVELLRMESLRGLSSAAAARVLSRAYSALVPVTPMPGEPLRLEGEGLVNFGPTQECVSPWMHLAVNIAAGCGLPGVVFIRGQRVWRLPPQLEAATHALLWPWDPTQARTPVTPVMVSAVFLLVSLNEYLTRTALLVQPLDANIPPGELLGGIHGWQLDMVYIPLPLPPMNQNEDGDSRELLGVHAKDGVELVVVSGAEQMLGKITTSLGLRDAIGYIRLLRVTFESSWLPMDVHLGMPLFSVELCRQVCSNAAKAGFLSPSSLEAHAEGHASLRRALSSLLAAHAAWGRQPGCTGQQQQRDREQQLADRDSGNEEGIRSTVDLPIHNIVFNGRQLKVADLSDFVHDLRW